MLNITLFYFFNNLVFIHPYLDSLVVFLAINYGWWLIGIATIFLLFHEHKKVENQIRNYWLDFKNKIKELFFVFGTSLFAWFLVSILKEIIKAPRPFMFLENVNKLFIHGSWDSFPSGHATFFAALAMSLFFYHRGLGIFYLISALAIGLSRVIAGVHFPIDILFGFLLGITIVLIFRKFIKKPETISRGPLDIK